MTLPEDEVLSDDQLIGLITAMITVKGTAFENASKILCSLSYTRR